jgi:hypothetical protein
MNRYKLARARSPERLKEVLDEDAELLSHFGLTLTAVEAGVSVVPTRILNTKKRVNPWDVMNINMSVWEFMLPLLEELRIRRTGEDHKSESSFVSASSMAAKAS